MTETEPTAENCTAQYDDDRLHPRGSDTIPWHRVRDLVGGGQSFWVATLGRGPRPHVRPVLGVWVDGSWCSTTGPATAKGRNLARDPRCSVALTTPGVDVVLEGSARMVTEADDMERIAAAYRDKYGWPVRVEGGAFTAPYGAPSAGPPPYLPYRVVPDVAFALGTDEQHAPRTTRYRFG